MGAAHHVFCFFALVVALLCSAIDRSSARVNFAPQDATYQGGSPSSRTEEEALPLQVDIPIEFSDAVKESTRRSYRNRTRGPREARMMATEEEDMDDEEEELYTPEELEVVNMMRAAQEEERDVPEGIWGLGAVKAHFSAHLVLWGILAAAVYVIMKGATRSDEKQKSLDVHRAVLKATQEKLTAGQEEARKALQERRSTQEDRLLLYRHSLNTASRISAILKDIQSVAQATDITGRMREMPDVQSKRRQRDGVSLVVPPAVRGCREGSLDLHMLLLNQGDTEYQEKVICRYLQQMADQKRSETPHEVPLQPQQQHKIDQAHADAWFEAAARSIGLEAGEKTTKAKPAGARGIKKGSRRPATTQRDRKAALLGIASVMLERKVVYEKELQEERQALRVLSDGEKQLAKAVKAQAAVVAKRLAQSLKDIKESFSSLEQQMTTDTEVEKAAIAAARKIVERLDSFENLFGGAPQGTLGTSKEIERAAQAQRKLMGAMRSNCEILGQQERRLAEAVDMIEKDNKCALFRAFRESMVTGYQQTAAAIASLSASQILADSTRKQNVIATATLREQERTTLASLGETDRWLVNAQKVFGPLQ